jgi:DnaK suppressor protein
MPKTARGQKTATAATTTADEAPELTPFLAAQRELLLVERETYTRQALALKAEAEQLAADMEPGDVQFDEESGEGDTVNVERERDLALSAQAMAEVQAIDTALEKIAAGTYGTCDRCGEPIPEERLEALPHAALCVRCKSGGLGRR